MRDQYERQQALKSKMLDKLEKDCNRLTTLGTKLDEIGDDVLNRLGSAIKEKQISPYKSAVAYSKLIDGISKLHKMSMDVYDRINGVVVGVDDMSIEEAVEVDQVEIDQQNNLRRDAEKLVLLLVQHDQKRLHPDELQKQREAKKAANE